MVKEYTLSMAQANSYALLLVIPIAGLFLVPYGWLYGWSIVGLHLVQFFTNLPLFFLSVIIGIAVHEYIHAVCWSWFDGIAWDRIHFGIHWKLLTPYVHCPEPIEVTNYRWGVAMPGIVLGIIPWLAALFLQNGWLLGFGLFFMLAAGGDILILWLLRSIEGGTLVQDHPDQVGCRLINPNEAPPENE